MRCTHCNRNGQDKRDSGSCILVSDQLMGNENGGNGASQSSANGGDRGLKSKQETYFDCSTHRKLTESATDRIEQDTAEGRCGERNDGARCGSRVYGG